MLLFVQLCFPHWEKEKFVSSGARGKLNALPFQITFQFLSPDSLCIQVAQSVRRRIGHLQVSGSNPPGNTKLATKVLFSLSLDICTCSFVKNTSQFELKARSKLFRVEKRDIDKKGGVTGNRTHDNQDRPSILSRTLSTIFRLYQWIYRLIDKTVPVDILSGQLNPKKYLEKVKPVKRTGQKVARSVHKN